jgi:hypothetical protein
MKIRLSMAALVAAASALLAASGATAANQSGLVNVDVSNNTIQVPIGVAVNVCQVSANVLSQATSTSRADCTALGDAQAFSTGTGGGGGTNQEGLINLAITDNTIQVPVAVAANLCEIAINVLAQDIQTGEANCTAVANATGRH